MTKKATTKKKTKVDIFPESDLAQRYLKNTKSDAYLLEQDMYPIKDWLDSGNYALNALLSGYWDRGYPTARFTQLAGPNSVGKTYLLTEALILAQKKGYTIYMIDSEFGSDAQSWIDRGVNPKMFIHNPIYHVKEIITELLFFLKQIEKDDKAIVIIDSVGNLSSNKETEDLEAGKGTRDMTRAQELKAMFRQLVVPAGKAGVPFWIVNHEYATMDLYSAPEQGGGCLTAGHLVKMDNCYKNIEDIYVGDKVLTLINEYKEVIDTHHYKKPTITIELDNNEVIECTEEHKFLVEYEDGLLWVEARNLTENDEILAIQ